MLLLVATTTSAAPVKLESAKTAVETWVRQVTADARPDAVIERMELHVVDGRTVGYIAHLSGGGYCLCGADDRLLPVYLYRTEGAYDSENPSYQYIFSRLQARLARLEQAATERSAELDQYEAELARRETYWADLISRRIPEPQMERGDRADPTSMSLRVDSYWHQHSPYNDQCPVLTRGTDEHVVVGCTATTAAQIMYYWKWPVTGTGSNSVEYNRRYRDDWHSRPLATDPQLDLPNPFWTSRLDWDPVNGGWLSVSNTWDPSIYWEARKRCNNGVDCEDADYHATLETLWDSDMIRDPTTCAADFGATTYSWSLMRDVHADDSVDSGDIAAATLSHHAGIAVGMSYGKLGSSAGRTRNGLVNYFRYDSDAYELARNVDAMVEDIQWLRPVEITGKEEGVGGHSWVACGYNKATTPWQFLMNIGWGAGSTEWFSVDEVFPDEQGNTVQIAPEEGVKFVGGGTRGDGSPNSPISSLQAALDSVPDDTLLIMKAGTTHTVASVGGVATLDKPIRLTGHKITILPE
jgi:hypothetical protein